MDIEPFDETDWEIEELFLGLDSVRADSAVYEDGSRTMRSFFDQQKR